MKHVKRFAGTPTFGNFPMGGVLWTRSAMTGPGAGFVVLAPTWEDIPPQVLSFLIVGPLGCLMTCSNHIFGQVNGSAQANELA